MSGCLGSFREPEGEVSVTRSGYRRVPGKLAATPKVIHHASDWFASDHKGRLIGEIARVLRCSAAGEDDHGAPTEHVLQESGASAH